MNLAKHCRVTICQWMIRLERAPAAGVGEANSRLRFLLVVNISTRMFDVESGKKLCRYIINENSAFMHVLCLSWPHDAMGHFSVDHSLVLAFRGRKTNSNSSKSTQPTQLEHPSTI